MLPLLPFAFQLFFQIFLLLLALFSLLFLLLLQLLLLLLPLYPLLFLLLLQLLQLVLLRLSFLGLLLLQVFLYLLALYSFLFLLIVVCFLAFAHSFVLLGNRSGPNPDRVDFFMILFIVHRDSRLPRGFLAVFSLLERICRPQDHIHLVLASIIGQWNPVVR